MVFPTFIRAIPAATAVLGGLMMVTVTPAAAAKARLVHCGTQSCLRLSGYRINAATTVRIGGRELAVDGGRVWQATVPLAVARTWPIAPGYALHVTVTDPETGIERSERMMLPPGALGLRREIASLVIRVH